MKVVSLVLNGKTVEFEQATATIERGDEVSVSVLSGATTRELVRLATIVYGNKCSLVYKDRKGQEYRFSFSESFYRTVSLQTSKTCVVRVNVNDADVRSALAAPNNFWIHLTYRTGPCMLVERVATVSQTSVEEMFETVGAAYTLHQSAKKKGHDEITAMAAYPKILILLFNIRVQGSQR